VEYADRYCGAAADEQYGYSYNKKYKNYNPLGGDCANFASQFSMKEANSSRPEHGGMKKTEAKHGQRPCFQQLHALQRQRFINRKRYLQSSFQSFIQASAGDYIAYEKKGKVVHISVVTGADSKGYTWSTATIQTDTESRGI